MDEVIEGVYFILLINGQSWKSFDAVGSSIILLSFPSWEIVGSSTCQFTSKSWVARCLHWGSHLSSLKSSSGPILQTLPPSTPMSEIMSATLFASLLTWLKDISECEETRPHKTSSLLSNLQLEEIFRLIFHWLTVWPSGSKFLSHPL